MLNKKYSFIIQCLALIFILCSCDSVIRSPVELLKAPKIESDQQKISDVIKDALPQGAYIARPIIASGLSSADFIDIDNDGNSEIYAFYIDKANTNVGIIVIENIGSKWVPVLDICEPGKDIAYSSFKDLNNDGVMELIFGFTDKDNNFKSLLVSTVVLNKSGASDTKASKTIYKDIYSDLLIDDIDGDGVPELVVFKLDRENFADISALKYVGDELVVATNTPLDPYINGYYNIVFGNISARQKAIIIDFKIGSKSATNILLYNKKAFKIAFDSFGASDNYRSTIKFNPISSTDIDNDGIIEIGSDNLASFYDRKNLSFPNLTSWYNYNDNTLELKSIIYTSPKRDFKLIVPKELLSAVTDESLAFVDSKPYRAEHMLEIYCFTENGYYKIADIERIASKDSSQNYDSRNMVFPRAVDMSSNSNFDKNSSYYILDESGEYSYIARFKNKFEQGEIIESDLKKVDDILKNSMKFIGGFSLSK